MRPRRLAPAAALLAVLALALAACTGGEPPPAAPTATPEASPAPEAPSTPAPTVEAPSTPTPAPPPEPPPEVACANGVAVEEPEARPGLVADCVALLASRDALRGEAALDWGGGLAIGRWEGVAVEGEPPRVVRLDLRDKGLTGSIPRTLRRLRLDEVRLAGNALTGCVPSAFGDARGDALYLGLPWCLRYDRLDVTGEVAEAGGWAILDGNGAVIATWEGLRSEAATLRVHQTDAGGTSWAAEFGAVSEGDLFEWRKASDCWVRYHVTGPTVRPSAGSGRWEFPVEWMTYAATGEGCTGAVGASAVLGADEAPAPVRLAVDSPSIETPVRHGPWLFVPSDWSGALELQEPIETPALPDASGASGASSDDTRHRLWRDPDLPAGWSLQSTWSWGRSGVSAYYQHGRGYLAARMWIVKAEYGPGYVKPLCCNVYETLIIDGNPAAIWYSLEAPGQGSTLVSILDRTTGITYSIDVMAPSVKHDVQAVIEMVRSLYR